MECGCNRTFAAAKWPCPFSTSASHELLLNRLHCDCTTAAPMELAAAHLLELALAAAPVKLAS